MQIYLLQPLIFDFLASDCSDFWTTDQLRTPSKLIQCEMLNSYDNHGISKKDSEGCSPAG